MTASTPSPGADTPSREAEVLQHAFDRRRRALRFYLGVLALPLASLAGLVAFGQSDLRRVRSVASATVAPAESAYRAIEPRLVAVGRLDTVLPRLDAALPLLDAALPRLDAVASEARTTAQQLARQDTVVRRVQADLTSQSQQLTNVRAVIAELPRVDPANLATVEQLRGVRDQLSRIEAQQAAVANAANQLSAAMETIQAVRNSVQRLNGRIDSIVGAERPARPGDLIRVRPERR